MAQGGGVCGRVGGVRISSLLSSSRGANATTRSRPEEKTGLLPAFAQKRFGGLQARHSSHSERRRGGALPLAMAGHELTFPRRDSRARVMHRLALENRGRGECRALGAPAASRAKVESTRVSHHRVAERFRHSPRDGFNGFLRSFPGVRACCLRPLHDAKHHRKVGKVNF